MTTMDSSMVNIALPAIMAHFDSTLQATEWVVLIYLLTITSSLLFWGHISDRYGRRFMYSVGLMLFSLSSAACFFAPLLAVLIICRFVQATGAAMMMSTGPAIIKENFPPEQLGRSLGLIGIAVSVGLMTGPSVGGVLLEYFSWRAIFFISVPVGLINMFVARSVLPATPVRDKAELLDWQGTLLWAGTMIFIALGLSLAHPGRISWVVLAGCGGAAASFFLFFMRREKKAPSPILPLSLFNKRYFTVAAACAVISFLVLFVAIILTPFYLAKVLNLSGTRIGLVMMAVPATVMIAAPLAGWLSDHVGAKYIATSGLLVSTVGIFLLSFMTSEESSWSVAARLMVLGCGQAMFLSPNSSSVLGRIDKSMAGIAAAMLATARNLGMLLGIAAAGLVFSHTFGQLTNGLDLRDFSPAQIPAFMAALHHAYLVGSIMGIMGIIVSWLRPVKERTG